MLFDQSIMESENFNADVKEKLFRHILGQKIFVCSKLVQILGLTQNDFELEDLRKLDPINLKTIFGTDILEEENQGDNHRAILLEATSRQNLWENGVRGEQ